MIIDPRAIDIECILKHIEEYSKFLPESMREEILSRVRQLRKEFIKEAKEYVEKVVGKTLDVDKVLNNNALKPIIMQVINRCKGGEREAPSKAL